MVMTSANTTRYMLRRTRSSLQWTVRWIASMLRVLRLRVSRDGVTIPWSTRIGQGVEFRVTDGGTLHLASNVNVASHCLIVVQGGRLQIGTRSFIGQGSVVAAKQSIVIGARALIAEYVTIRDQQHRIDSQVEVADAGFTTAPIVIGDDVWIAAKASVFQGSTIGPNAVIGAHALVKGNIPAGAVAVGVPARVVRYRQVLDNTID